MSLNDLVEAVERKEVDTVVLAFADMVGQLVGKRLSARHFLEVAHSGVHACDYLLANDIEMEPVPGYKAANWERGYGDFCLRSDFGAVFRVPWLPGTAVVYADAVDHNATELPHSPRAILKRQLARATEAGLKILCATELEFYHFGTDYPTLNKAGYRNIEPGCSYIEDYHIFQTSKEEVLFRAIRNGLIDAGVPVEGTKGEWGPGQAEINVRYSAALQMADRHVFMKNAIKEIAFLQGKAVTFMAKWRDDLAGSSAHIHISAVSALGDRSLFYDGEACHGMSDVMRRFVAGQVKHAQDIALFLAPNVNSYKRFQAGTFAPTRSVWSLDNRTSGFRVCGAGSPNVRIECRIGGADLNPYLAIAALVAAGLDGILSGLELSDPYDGDAYGADRAPFIPRTLREATERARQSRLLLDAFGEEVMTHYLHAAEWEQREHDRHVTDWELKRGFERG